jgi:hypothetical protein
VDFWGGMNPNFFKGTRVEKAAADWLSQHPTASTDARAAK